MNVATIVVCLLFWIACVSNPALSMNYDPVSNPKLMSLQTAAFRFKELLGIIDQRVQAATDLEAGIVALAREVDAEDLNAADRNRYGEICKSVKPSREHLQPYKESMRSRRRWLGCICFCRSRKR